MWLGAVSQQGEARQDEGQKCKLLILSHGFLKVFQDPDLGFYTNRIFTPFLVEADVERKVGVPNVRTRSENAPHRPPLCGQISRCRARRNERQDRL